MKVIINGKIKYILILDCTLRDGGYALGDKENENRFGRVNILNIIKYLHEAGIDYIECGYIKENANDPDKTEFKSYEELDDILQSGKKHSLMLLGQEYNIENLPEAPTEGLIIRMSFHRDNIERAIEYAKEISKKGYKLFLQPTAITKYTNEVIIKMIEEFNKLDVEAIALVDTFGVMMPEDARRYAMLFDEHLRDGIKLGVHLHDNKKMAFSNAITICESVKESRTVIVDTSLHGMGRGAGNLPTELFADYLNENGAKYKMAPLLQANDTIIDKYHETHRWGYLPAYMLSASYSCHPNYVIYLLNRKKLNSEDIENILSMISEDKKEKFDAEYLEELYQTYNNNVFDDTNSYERLRRLAAGKEVILIGPGKSLNTHGNMIEDYIGSRDCLVITVNGSSFFAHDAVFYSNKKRYAENTHPDNEIEIVTSNISTDEQENRIIFDYRKSLYNNGEISDSALLMALQILYTAGITNVTVAGFDGFSTDNNENFLNPTIAYLLKAREIESINGINKAGVTHYQKTMNMQIGSLTPSQYFKRRTI